MNHSETNDDQTTTHIGLEEKEKSHNRQTIEEERNETESEEEDIPAERREETGVTEPRETRQGRQAGENQDGNAT